MPTERKARESLAAYFEENGSPWTANLVRQGASFDLASSDALRAIARALESAGQGEAFVNLGDSEAQFIAHHADACPHCGGSGHAGDMATRPEAQAGGAVAELEVEWTMDCGGKQDYDADLVTLSTRYWPRGGGFLELTAGGRFLGNEDRPEIPPSAHSTIYLQGESLAEAKFTGETEAEVKAQVEAWAREQWASIYRKLTTPPAKVPEGWRRAGTVRITPEGYVHLSADVEQLSAARDAGHGAAVYVAAAPAPNKENGNG